VLLAERGKEQGLERRKQPQAQALVAEPPQAAGHDACGPKCFGTLVAPQLPRRAPQAAPRRRRRRLQPHFHHFRGEEQRFEQRRRDAARQHVTQQRAWRAGLVARRYEGREKAEHERRQGPEALQFRVRTQPPQPRGRPPVETIVREGHAVVVVSRSSERGSRWRSGGGSLPRGSARCCAILPLRRIGELGHCIAEWVESKQRRRRKGEGASRDH
jgi:hypothetical protein